MRSSEQIDDADAALQLLAHVKRIRQGVSRLAMFAKAGDTAVRAGTPYNWMEYEHCRNALAQLGDGACVFLGASAEANHICADAQTLANTPVDAEQRADDLVKKADDLVKRAERFYVKVNKKQEKKREDTIMLIGAGDSMLPLGTRVVDRRNPPVGKPGRTGRVRSPFSSFVLGPGQMVVAWDDGSNEEGIYLSDVGVVTPATVEIAKKEGIQLQGPEQVERGLKIVGKLLASIVLGTVASTVGLAWLWRAHRILGGLLGFFVVGPVVGTGIGLLLTYHAAKRLKEDAEKNPQTPVGRVAKTIVGSYLAGSSALIGTHGGWHHDEEDRIEPGKQRMLDAPGETLDEQDVVLGELESLIESDWGTPGMPISADMDAEPGKPLVLAGGGGHHGGWGRGRGWGGGWGWGYPYGPPLDYGYTTVVQDTSAADLAIAEAIQKNTELQRKLAEKEAASKGKAVVGHRGGGHGGGGMSSPPAFSGGGGGTPIAPPTPSSGSGGGGWHGGDEAQGFFRGGWYGGDYPTPFAYTGPYEDVDTAIDQSLSSNALAEVMQQNADLEKQFDAKAREVGGSFADFDNRTIWYTGKMRGGR